MKTKMTVGIVSSLTATIALWSVGLPEAQAADALQCGSVLTASYTMTANLDCSAYTGTEPLLTINGDNVILDGAGFVIKARSTAPSGILVYGSSNTVTRVRITGLRTGVGITAIDTLNLKIYNNVIKYASIGLKVVADQKTITRLKVIGNNFSNASEFGIQYADSGSFKIGYSTISNNILKYIGGVALFINASDLELRDANYNDFYGSNNGIFFTGGSLKLIKLHLEYYQIKKVGVSIYNADALVADRLGLMPGGPATAAQDRVCLSALAVKNVQLSNSYIRGCDIGVALVSSGGVPSTATITNSAIINNAIAGIMIKTEDQISPFGAVNIFSNNLRGNPPDNAIWLIDPATIAWDSIRYGNGF